MLLTKVINTTVLLTEVIKNTVLLTKVIKNTVVLAKLFNPIPAGVLENQDTLGGGQFAPPL